MKGEELLKYIELNKIVEKEIDLIESIINKDDRFSEYPTQVSYMSKYKIQNLKKYYYFDNFKFENMMTELESIPDTLVLNYYDNNNDNIRIELPIEILYDEDKTKYIDELFERQYYEYQQQQDREKYNQKEKDEREFNRLKEKLGK